MEVTAADHTILDTAEVFEAWNQMERDLQVHASCAVAAQTPVIYNYESCYNQFGVHQRLGTYLLWLLSRSLRSSTSPASTRDI
jgi:hypothetical protein